MTSSRLSGSALAALLLTSLSSISMAQPATPSAGAMALLANNMNVAAIDVVKRGLDDPDPMVRAVAARVAATTPLHALAGPLRAALIDEQHDRVAAEQARALLLLDVGEPVSLVESRLDSTPIALVYAGWLSLTQPAKLAGALPRLATVLGDDRRVLHDYVIAATERDPSQTETLIRAWRAVAGADAWRELASYLIMEATGPAREALLTESLSSPDPAIREATVWAIVAGVAQRGRVPVSLIVAGASSAWTTIEGTAAAGVTWEQVGRQALARRAGQQAQARRVGRSPELVDPLTAHGATRFADMRHLALLGVATQAERKVLEAVLGEQYPRGPEQYTPAARTGTAMRTTPTIWPGLLGQVGAAAGCRWNQSPPRAELAAVEYHADGRVRKIETFFENSSRECQQVVLAMTRLTVDDPGGRPLRPTRELLVLPLDPEHVACVAEPDAHWAGSLHRRGRTAGSTSPDLLTNRKPEYPRRAKASGVQGVVYLDAVVSRTGCISHVQVRRSLEVTLDYAAIQALVAWVFRPATIAGHDTASHIEVEMSFTLRR